MEGHSSHLVDGIPGNCSYPSPLPGWWPWCSRPSAAAGAGQPEVVVVDDGDVVDRRYCDCVDPPIKD